MSPEAQRIAIAEACGWTKIHLYRSQLEHRNLNVGVRHGDHLEDVSQLPDYLTDLNAMHEVEKALPADSDDGIDRRSFRTHLRAICLDVGSDAIHSTAAQRAEAFLRTVGKWEDGK